MSKSTNNTGPRRNEDVWLAAENYHLSEVHQRFRLHPEGLPRITRNCLLIGQLGVGKTMVLKKLCYDFRDAPNKFPIYIPLNSWIRKILSETTYPWHTQQSPLEKDLVSCMTIVLSLALIDGALRYGGYQFVQDTVALYPSFPLNKSDFSQWMKSQIAMVRPVLESGSRLTTPYTSFPTLFNVADTIGQSGKAMNKTVVFLIDQLDKIPLSYFEVIKSLLHRGNHIAIIATRPCPCAPEPSILPPTMVIGNDYDIHWLGQNPRTPKWRNFILKILENSPFDKEVIEIAAANIKPLTSLAGPSVRTVIKICIGIESGLQERLSKDKAWGKAVRLFVDEEKTMAMEVMGAWCERPDRILGHITNSAMSVRQKRGKGPGPVVARIRNIEDLFLSEQAEKFLRTCVREAIFIPLRPALEAIQDRYEVNPLLITPGEEASFSTFDDEICEFDIVSKDLKQWIHDKPRGGGRTVKNVFVPLWMSDPEESGALARLLRERALGRFNVLTGEDIHNSEQWSPEIRKFIERSDVVVCDLSVPRRDIYVEWGWAVGKHKQVLLGCKAPRYEKKIPEWAIERTIHIFGNGSDTDAFVSKLLHMLDRFPNRVAKWFDDPSNSSMAYSASPKVVGLIGHGDTFFQLQTICNSAAQECGMSFESLFSEGEKEIVKHGGILFDCIPLARRAGTLVLVFDGTEADFLTCVGGGVFTSSDYFYMGKKKRKKRLFLVNPLGANSREMLSGLLATKPGVKTCNSTTIFQTHFRKHLAAINKWRKEIISKTRH